ncbi:kyphoscoliosis peptidase-like [Hemicordylus capensis]|uniref:kyphoscoliosis peptidase-like n=1 Tax=Hemicordylus capensis TaxID=884348 RepID=UPI002303EB10|nr:kyphoscoliosis peptidase-like [Hemicordylus capensis]XP_053109586.1 kyphoscoliosis peptidase-like [Hemicordylus capensis]
MEPDGHGTKLSKTAREMREAKPLPFVSPSVANNNFHGGCAAVNRAGHAQKNSNHKEKRTCPPEDAYLSECQVTDIWNGNIPVAGSPSEAPKPWPLGNPGCGHHGQGRKGISLAKTATDAQKDSPTKNIFLFWANQVDGGLSKVTPKRPAVQKPPEQSQLGGHSHGIVSKVGVGSVKGRDHQTPSGSPAAAYRKRRRDLIPDSDIFRQLDAHVLCVGEQLTPQQGPWSIQTVVPLITRGAESQLQKVRAIWMWMCHNIKYDVDGFLGLSEKIHRPEQVLQTGKGVCSGYAHLYHEMCKEAGVACVEISGYGRGAGSRQGQSCLQKKSNHMWNAVKLEADWFLLDACWGAGLVDAEKRLFIPRHDDFFFLTDPEHFIETHWPDEPEWQLLPSPVSLEDFEERVFKTPEFFKLQLSLFSPDTSVLKTDQGEAAVSLASTLPTEFTYQLLKLGHDNFKEDVGKAHGMLTGSDKKMALKVFPPSPGLFDLQIFARPSGSPTPYTWVCSYQIRCLESNGKESLPENPFPFWGLHPKAEEFGIAGCNWGEDLTVATTGTLKLAMQTKRALLATYELVHPGLDDSLRKKCLVSQTEEEQLSCQVLCPFVGYYRLSVFVKGLGEDEFKNTANFLISCSGPINHNELFPLGLSSHCGAGISSQWRGLSNPSHLAPIIDTKQGRCNITFHIQPGFEVTATLSKDKVMNNTYPMERYILTTHLENKVSISVLLPESGLYRVGLYGRNADSKEFTHVCDYVVRCSTSPQWLPFPRVYSLWRRGCVLLQPRTGVLQEESWVRFRLKMPKALSALVVGHARTELKLGRNKVWEGEVYTGPAGTRLKVAVKFSSKSSSMEVILSFDVEGCSSTSDGASG